MEVNKIYNTNCIDFMRGGVLNNKVDLVLTDPPYEFISNQTTFSGDLKNRKHLQDINTSFGMKFNPVELLELCKTVCKKFNGYFFTNKNLLTKYIGWAEENKYKRDLLLWLKPNPVPISAWHYLIDKEYIVYIHETWATYNTKLEYHNYYTYQSTPIHAREFDHPTIKPKEILYNKIKISSNEGDLIFDPYMGSGTTAVACKELNRNYIGCEINPKYIDIANKRLSNIQQSLF